MSTQQKSWFNPKMYNPIKERLTAEGCLNPWGWLQPLREQAPVRFDADRDTWDLFRFEDAHRVFMDHQTFSARRVPNDSPISESMIYMDPPVHTQFRNVVSKAFTQQTISAMAPRIQAIIDNLLECLPSDREIDVIKDIGIPLPVIVIAELLGVPFEDQPKFKEWSDISASGVDGDTPEAIAEFQRAQLQAFQEMGDYFAHIIAKRRVAPQNDLISALVKADIGGQELSDEALFGFCTLLLVAGNETTTNLIANSIRCFIDFPEEQAKLRGNLHLMPSAIEEVLRYLPPVQMIERVATKKTNLAGYDVKAGQGIAIWIASANRDERKFANPNQFKIDRTPNQHITFGAGAHFCLGAPLARLEGHIALTTMLKKIKSFQLIEGTQLQVLNSPFVYGFKSLPIRIDV